MWKPGWEESLGENRYIRQEVCNFLCSVSLKHKFAAAGQCYSSVTPQFYLASKGQYILKAWGQANPKQACSSILAPLFFLFIPTHPEPALCKWGEPGGLFASPEVLTLVLGASFVIFLWAFSFFFFFCLLATTILDSFFLF